ncbi:MAG: clan AA aspartic protease [Patescibacteria group bacterium]
MKVGYFNQHHHHPKVDFELFHDGGTIELSALIDTGFDGELTLPFSLVEKFKLPLIETSWVELADGKISQVRVYRAAIQWFNVKRSVSAFTTGSSEILIGTELLRANSLIINFPKKEG